MFENYCEYTAIKYDESTFLEMILETGVYYITTIMNEINFKCLSLQEQVIRQFFQLIHMNRDLREHGSFVVAFAITEVLLDQSKSSTQILNHPMQLRNQSQDTLNVYSCLVADFSENIDTYEHIYEKLIECKKQSSLKKKTTYQYIHKALMNFIVSESDHLLIENLLHVIWSHNSFYSKWMPSQRAFAILSVLESLNCLDMDLRSVLSPYQNDKLLTQCAQQLLQLVQQQQQHSCDSGYDDLSMEQTESIVVHANPTNKSISQE